ncbi:hypothetical protein COBT_003300, partial [Conglomerata obtusa]
MRFLVLLFSCDSFYATSEILTPEGIYKELKTFQEQQIAMQKKCFELHQHDSFIMIGFDSASDTFIEQLKGAIINLLKDYLEVTKNCDIQITSKILNNDLGTLDIHLILEFFQNAYIFNLNISNEKKTHDEIFKQYNYKINHAVKNVEDINEIVNSHHQRRQQNVIKNSNGCYWQNRCNDIILITNCLGTLEDYEFLYNEYIKHEEIYHGKT